MLRSQRFVEYFAPTATFFAALAGGGRRSPRFAPRPAPRCWSRLLAVVLIANVDRHRLDAGAARAKTPYDKFAAAAELVAREAPPGRHALHDRLGRLPVALLLQRRRART